jgi:hypothetical protein
VTRAALIGISGFVLKGAYTKELRTTIGFLEEGPHGVFQSASRISLIPRLSLFKTDTPAKSLPEGPGTTVANPAARINRGREFCRSAGAVRRADSSQSPVQWHRRCREREASSFVVWSSLWSSFIGAFNVLLARQVAICLEDRQQETET